MEPEVAQKIEIWKTTVATQQHFNGLQLQLRSFLITLFLAVLTAAAYALKERMMIQFGTFSASLSSVVCGFGALMILAFYSMDWGYHQLLLGAVKYGEQIEEELRGLSGIGLTHAISEGSKKKKFLFFFPTSSHTRLRGFYALLAMTMIAASLGAQFAATTAMPTVTPVASRTPSPYAIAANPSGTLPPVPTVTAIPSATPSPF